MENKKSFEIESLIRAFCSPESKVLLTFFLSNNLLDFTYEDIKYQIKEKSIKSVPHDKYQKGDQIPLFILPEDPQRYAVFKAEVEQKLLYNASSRIFKMGTYYSGAYNNAHLC